MIVLLVLGALGVKAALIVYIFYRLARWLTKRGDAIKEQYESSIHSLQQSIRILEKEKRALRMGRSKKASTLQ